MEGMSNLSKLFIKPEKNRVETSVIEVTVLKETGFRVKIAS